MQMPEIKQCEVETCAYNHGSECHALAITVGHASSPMCDTYWDASMKGGDPQKSGHVGACHMANCMFNQSLECQADNGISVGLKSDEVDCLTFKMK